MDTNTQFTQQRWWRRRRRHSRTHWRRVQQMEKLNVKYVRMEWTKSRTHVDWEARPKPERQVKRRTETDGRRGGMRGAGGGGGGRG